MSHVLNSVKADNFERGTVVVEATDRTLKLVAEIANRHGLDERHQLMILFYFVAIRLLYVVLKEFASVEPSLSEKLYVEALRNVCSYLGYDSQIALAKRKTQNAPQQ